MVSEVSSNAHSILTGCYKESQGGSMRYLMISGFAGLVVLAAACANGSYTSQAHRNECERRGVAPGSTAYDRCIRDLQGREVIDLSFTRGRSRRTR